MKQVLSAGPCSGRCGSQRAEADSAALLGSKPRGLARTSDDAARPDVAGMWQVRAIMQIRPMWRCTLGQETVDW